MALHNSLHTGSATGYVQAVDARLSMGGILAIDGNGATPALGVRSGVVYGPGNPLLVTGTASTSPWQYSVAAGSAVTSKGNLDGSHIVVNDASFLVSTIAPPASNSRYDAVYIMQQDSAATISPDASTAPVIGVVNGTAGAAPAVPTIPAGAVLIGVALVASTATAGTSGAGVTITTSGTVGSSPLIAPYTAARGVAVPCRNSTEYPASPVVGMRVLNLALGYTLTYFGSAWIADVDAWVGGEPVVTGTIPTAGARKIRYSGSIVYTINSFGQAAVVFPHAFPNALVSFVVTSGDSTATTTTLTVNYANTSKTTAVLQCLSGSGASVTSGTVRFNYIAEGW